MSEVTSLVQCILQDPITVQLLTGTAANLLSEAIKCKVKGWLQKRKESPSESTQVLQRLKSFLDDYKRAHGQETNENTWIANSPMFFPEQQTSLGSLSQDDWNYIIERNISSVTFETFLRELRYHEFIRPYLLSPWGSPTFFDFRATCPSSQMTNYLFLTIVDKRSKSFLAPIREIPTIKQYCRKKNTPDSFRSGDYVVIIDQSICSEDKERVRKEIKAMHELLDDVPSLARFERLELDDLLTFPVEKRVEYMVRKFSDVRPSRRW